MSMHGDRVVATPFLFASHDLHFDGATIHVTVVKLGLG